MPKTKHSYNNSFMTSTTIRKKGQDRQKVIVCKKVRRMKYLNPTLFLLVNWEKCLILYYSSLFEIGILLHGRFNQQSSIYRARIVEHPTYSSIIQIQKEMRFKHFNIVKVSQKNIDAKDWCTYICTYYEGREKNLNEITCCLLRQAFNLFSILVEIWNHDDLQ